MSFGASNVVMSFADKMSTLASVASPAPPRKKKRKGGGTTSGPNPSSSVVSAAVDVVPPVVLGGPVTMIPAPSSITDSEKEEMVAQISRLINEQEMMPQAKMKVGW